MQSNKSLFKYTLTVKGVVIYYAWLIANVSLLSVEKIDALQTSLGPFFSHVSNFIITSLLMSVVALIWIMQGAPFRFVIILGLVAITLNFVVELFVRVLNTPDIWDAAFGSAGVLLTVCVAWVLKKIALREAVG